MIRTISSRCGYEPCLDRPRPADRSRHYSAPRRQRACPAWTAKCELLQWRAPWTESCHASSILLGRHDDLAERIADLADAYIERIAIVLEARDIGEADARRIAEAEIGAAFVQSFMPGEVSA